MGRAIARRSHAGLRTLGVDREVRIAKRRVRTSWDPVAAWYEGWVGPDGSNHHKAIAIPAVIALLGLSKGESVIDIGCGHGVLAPHVAKAGSRYTGIDASQKLIDAARKHHGRHGRFLSGDALALQKVAELKQDSFDAAVFLLSIQDMDPLEPAIQAAKWAVKPGGRLVMLTLHPCYRVPRQSGWGWDEGRKLQYRRVDRYLTPLPVPVKSYPGQRQGTTVTFHRPLSLYINLLGEAGFFVDRLDELPTYKVERAGPRSKAINRSNREIPLFLAMRAWRRAPTP